MPKYPKYLKYHPKKYREGQRALLTGLLLLNNFTQTYQDDKILVFTKQQKFDYRHHLYRQQIKINVSIFINARRWHLKSTKNKHHAPIHIETRAAEVIVTNYYYNAADAWTKIQSLLEYMEERSADNE